LNKLAAVPIQYWCDVINPYFRQFAVFKLMASFIDYMVLLGVAREGGFGGVALTKYLLIKPSLGWGVSRGVSGVGAGGRHLSFDLRPALDAVKGEMRGVDVIGESWRISMKL
jgi:hypothetical protein